MQTQVITMSKIFFMLFDLWVLQLLIHITMLSLFPLIIKSDNKVFYHSFNHCANG